MAKIGSRFILLQRDSIFLRLFTEQRPPSLCPQQLVEALFFFFSASVCHKVMVAIACHMSPNHGKQPCHIIELA